MSASHQSLCIRAIIYTLMMVFFSLAWDSIRCKIYNSL